MPGYEDENSSGFGPANTGSDRPQRGAQPLQQPQDRSSEARAHAGDPGWPDASTSFVQPSADPNRMKKPWQTVELYNSSNQPRIVIDRHNMGQHIAPHQTVEMQLLNEDIEHFKMLRDPNRKVRGRRLARHPLIIKGISEDRNYDTREVGRHQEDEQEAQRRALQSGRGTTEWEGAAEQQALKEKDKENKEKEDKAREKSSRDKDKSK